MKTSKKVLNVIGLGLGLVFVLVGGSDIQFGFGAILMLMSLNELL
jgi:hypothetical protein